jgi:hypothetical protein
MSPTVGSVIRPRETSLPADRLVYEKPPPARLGSHEVTTQHQEEFVALNDRVPVRSRARRLRRSPARVLGWQRSRPFLRVSVLPKPLLKIAAV